MSDRIQKRSQPTQQPSRSHIAPRPAPTPSTKSASLSDPQPPRHLPRVLARRLRPSRLLLRRPLRAHAITPLYTQKALYLVLGGLAYSAKTVWQWGTVAFQNAFKAFGFVVLLEGVMVTSHILWLSITALVYLMAINGIATGCNLTAKASR